MTSNEAVAKLAEVAWPKIFFMAALAAVLFYFLGVDKGIGEQGFVNAENQRKQAEATLKKTKEAMSDLKKFRSEIDSLNTQFTQMTSYMSAEPNFSDLVVNLQKLANQSGAVVRRVSPSNKVDQAEFYQTSRIMLELEGTYPQLLGFLSDLSKLRRLVTIEEMDLGSASGADVKTAPITFKTTIVGYRYAPAPTPTPDPSKPQPPAGANAH